MTSFKDTLFALSGYQADNTWAYPGFADDNVSTLSVSFSLNLEEM